MFHVYSDDSDKTWQSGSTMGASFCFTVNE